MITRQHLTLVLLSLAILLLSRIPLDPWGCLAILLGACIGAIVPDIQMKKPKRLRALSLAWVITRFARYTFIPIIILFYRIIFGFREDPSDKRITHSIPGTLILAGSIAGLAFIPMTVLSTLPGTALIPLFVLGFCLGLILHMVQDLCTRKGITPLYPFRTLSLHGSIRPCIVTDTRIGRFQVHHCGAAAGILGIQYCLNLPGFVVLGAGLATLILCLGLMIHQSDVLITRNPDGIKDPTSVPGIPTLSLG